MERKITLEARITPDELLEAIGATPADNPEGYDTAVSWKSQLAGQQIRAMLRWQYMLEGIRKNPFFFGPMSLGAGLQSDIMENSFLGHVKAHARIAARTGRNPDLFGEMNAFVYTNYADVLYNLCRHFIKGDKFDRRIMLETTCTREGKEYLKNYLNDFTELEKSYSSRGLTRLKAMKDLLKSILIVITETPPRDGDIPFMKKNADGTWAQTFEQYLEENQNRLVYLFKENAFDIREFSERITGGKIGFSPYEYVRGSKMNSVRLRQYRTPKGVEPNGKILYFSTPLINKPEILDLAEGKSVVAAVLAEGFEVYMVDFGNPGSSETELGLGFFGKTVHDHYISLIQKRHPGHEIFVMGYCMCGTLMFPYLARRAEELEAQGKEMDIKKIAVMAAPVKFDDAESGHGSIREVIRRGYDPVVMDQLFGPVNIPPQVIDSGMNEIQPGVQYTVSLGFYGRVQIPHAAKDAAPFLYWLTHGTRFPAKAHREWIERVFMGNEIAEGKYRLPSSVPELDGKPVDMGALRRAGVQIFSYRGTRDPIAPAGSCVASELWGMVEDGNLAVSRGGLNRTIEKNVGHIFVVSKQLLAEYLDIVLAFFRDERPGEKLRKTA
ncbi:MAG: hypothetical protein WCY54_05505 [Syntrophales bacterium]